MTPSGRESATFRFAAQRLKQLHHRVPPKRKRTINITTTRQRIQKLHKYRKLNNNTKMPLQLTRFIYSVLFTYPFPILRTLSPHSISTNLHIFLSHSYSFLLVVGSWLLCPIHFFCVFTTVEITKFSYALTEISYFSDLEKPGIFCFFF